MDWDRLLHFLPDRIVCVSRRVQERFRGIPKALTIYNGVDTEDYRPEIDGSSLRDQWGISASECLVGMAARIGPGKGQDIFLRALAQVTARRKEVKGVIVGKPFRDVQGQEKTLQALTQDLGLTGCVKFVGFYEDIPKVMAAFDIYIMPTYAEPFGRSLLEAMSCGKAIIATRAGGTTEVLTHQESGLLVTPRDDQALTEAILFLLDHPEERRRLGQGARLRIEASFTFRTNVEAIEALYLEILSQRKGIHRKG